MSSPREICLRLLDSTERGHEYSNIALDAALKSAKGLKPVDRRFIAALYYGVLERRMTLDEIIRIRSSRPSDRLGSELRQILRMGLYQILYMDTVPESAAVNESVKLARRLANPAAAGFVNALLRGFLRDGKSLPFTGVKLKDLSIKYSCPEWIVSLWLSDYGEEDAVKALEASLLRAPITARLNTCKFSLEDILSELSAENICVKISDFTDSCANLTGAGSVEELSAYKKGMLHIQDLSCQLCCSELDPKEGETVLDLCAAPGGKSFTLAEMMGDKGQLIACDLHKNRVKLIESGANRLNLRCVKAFVNDAKKFSPVMPKADKILCDVPCSGLGVIRRKPEIKYRAEENPDALIKTQYDILETSSRYLKPGGTIIYSTCTLRRAENDENVERFLDGHPDFEPVKLNNFTGWKTTIMPDKFNSDGFFIAKIHRKR